jgi:pimeloyl-ACP methyl ester carboxylesterase
MRRLRRTTRRSLLWVLGALAVALLAVLAVIDERMWDAGGPGIVGFELAGSEDSAREILAEWGEEGRDAARLSLWLDFPYLVVYGAFWALAAAAIRDLARRRDWSRYAAAGSVAIVLAVVAALFDAVENVGLLLTVDEQGGALSPRLAMVAASGKFVLIGVVIAYVAIGLARRAFGRFPRAARVGAVAIPLIIVALIAVNTWSVERETEEASAEIGGLLDLPGGDLHVREDGDPRSPPLVLIHGFAVSMHWWDRVVPILAREHHVIRIDLLGHGGSEKPRDGYSMEHQADLVAAALRRLGTRRTPVVGHSMGGLVGTALVERHRELVSRLMTIGTPPDRGYDASSDIGDQLASVPVIGHAGWRLIADRMIRAELEGTFIPEFEVPDQFVEDINRTTFSSFTGSGDAVGEYWDEKPVDERLADEELPLTVVYGKREQVVEPEAADEFRDVPGARIVLLDGVGHSPQVEEPARTARLILAFAR